MDIENPTVCRYCGEPVYLRSSDKIYGSGLDYGLVYVCAAYPTCDSYVGVYKGTNKANGTLADKELRGWRTKTHKAFDPLWKSHGMTRSEACKFLSVQLGIEQKDAHISRFDIYECIKIIDGITKPYAACALLRNRTGIEFAKLER